MAKRHHRMKRLDWKDTTPEDVLVALQARAVELSEQQQHSLGEWQPAKKKWGKGAKQAWCPSCAGVVIVLPYGGEAHVGKGGRSMRDMPAIIGDAVFEKCEAVS